MVETKHDIGYVCLSDTHFGEEDSLLTSVKRGSSLPELDRPSPVLSQLIECLKDLIAKNEGDQKPTLILNGDILELALSLTHEAAMVFKRFLELCMPVDQDQRLFDRLIFIPGNHDHHLWELARETQYVEYIKRHKVEDLPKEWHTTELFVENASNPVPAYFLSGLIKSSANLENIDIQVVYPNFGMISNNGQKCVLFHHGHFFEPIYRLVSTIKHLLFPERAKAETVDDIERENFAWIDFFWSTLGRSSDAGAAMESIYEHMLHPQHFRKILLRLARGLASRYGLPDPFYPLETSFHYMNLRLVESVIRKSERRNQDAVLSRSTRKGLFDYMETPFLDQISSELKSEIPSKVSLVFGHTHKPFQDRLKIKGFPSMVDTYNTGGWVIDTIHRRPLHGAAVVLMDREFNLCSLRMFNEGYYIPKVEACGGHGLNRNPFYRRITELVNPYLNPWKDFSQIVADEVEIRAQNLLDRLVCWN
jgi:UDP-2,3-diacylglucosamine pyrophosphatase LpxH